MGLSMCMLLSVRTVSVFPAKHLFERGPAFKKKKRKGAKEKKEEKKNKKTKKKRKKEKKNK